MSAFDVIGFDADDTLWHSEDGFRANEERFVELIAPWAPEGVGVKAALTATERKNLAAFGYGVKSFGLSMVEAAVTISGGRVPSTVVAEMIEMVRTQLEEPVRLLDHVPEVLAEVGAERRLILITKGDLIHQTHKVTTSGLAHHFEHVEIVLEKDPETYAGLLSRSASTRHGSAWSATACAATSCPCWRSVGTGYTFPTRCCGTSSRSITTNTSSSSHPSPISPPGLPAAEPLTLSEAAQRRLR